VFLRPASDDLCCSLDSQHNRLCRRGCGAGEEPNTESDLAWPRRHVEQPVCVLLDALMGRAASPFGYNGSRQSAQLAREVLVEWRHKFGHRQSGLGRASSPRHMVRNAASLCFRMDAHTDLLTCGARHHSACARLCGLAEQQGRHVERLASEQASRAAPVTVTLTVALALGG